MGRLDPRIDFAGAGEGQHPQLTKVDLQLLAWPGLVANCPTMIRLMRPPMPCHFPRAAPMASRYPRPLPPLGLSERDLALPELG